MEEKDVLEIIAENEKRFREEKDLKKSITEVIEKHDLLELKLAVFMEFLKKKEKAYKVFEFLRLPLPNEVSEFHNAIKVYMNINEGRLLILKKLGIYLYVMLRSQENIEKGIINERTIKTLSLINPLLYFIEIECSNNNELIKNHLNSMKEKKPFILDEYAVDKKRYIGNSIDEIRRILNNN